MLTSCFKKQQLYNVVIKFFISSLNTKNILLLSSIVLLLPFVSYSILGSSTAEILQPPSSFQILPTRLTPTATSIHLVPLLFFSMLCLRLYLILSEQGIKTFFYFLLVLLRALKRQQPKQPFEFTFIFKQYFLNRDGKRETLSKKTK